jgi:hypothetical protein
MKKQINEIKRMQQLSGIIKESQLNEVEEIEDDALYTEMESSINEADLDAFIDAANNIGDDLLKAGYQAPQIYSYLYTVMINQA